LIGFNSGTYESIDISEWLAGNPKDVVITNFGLKEGEIEKFRKRKYSSNLENNFCASSYKNPAP
jgi:hypothetical protein